MIRPPSRRWSSASRSRCDARATAMRAGGTRSSAQPPTRSPGRSCARRGSRRSSCDRPGTPAHFCEEFLEPGVFSPRIRALFESALAGDLQLSVGARLRRARPSRTTRPICTCARSAREGRATACRRCGSTICCTRHRLTPTTTAWRGPASWPLGSSRSPGRADSCRRSRGGGGGIERGARGGPTAARAATARAAAHRQPRPWRSPGRSFSSTAASYAALANRAAAEAEQRAPLPGPRLVLAGAWLDDERLHALVESHGAVVVAEDGGWGSRSAGRDIERRDDLVAAIFDKYLPRRPERSAVSAGRSRRGFTTWPPHRTSTASSSTCRRTTA